ncbi:gamma-butyrobetaine dioxygenase [Pyricularia oryzae Y34]|nr:gamma-butyrobetaine dioxygenase [Pyricularia oryzae Y34]
MKPFDRRTNGPTGQKSWCTRSTLDTCIGWYYVDNSSIFPNTAAIHSWPVSMFSRSLSCRLLLRAQTRLPYARSRVAVVPPAPASRFITQRSATGNYGCNRSYSQPAAQTQAAAAGAAAASGTPEHHHAAPGPLAAAWDSGSRTLAVRFNDGLETPLSKLWLRDSCRCSACVDSSSGQKNFETCDVPSSLRVRKVGVAADGESVQVVWGDDFLTGGQQSHASVYPASFIQSALDRPKPKDDVVRHTTWDKASFEKQVRFIPYSEWIKGEGEVFWRGFLDLARLGLVFIKDVPESETAVEEMACAVGHAQTTFYGKTWDVVSKPQAENVAYTNVFLCLHQDLLYMQDPPRLQLLHCLANSCEGGESLFSDGIRAAEQVRSKNPKQFELLKNKPVYYHYDKNGHWYEYNRPVVTLSKDGSGAIDSIGWSPPFQDNFPAPQGLSASINSQDALEEWRAAARSFRDSSTAPESMFEYKMKPGECAIFDNMRILHGRRQFQLTSGKRWLKGTYVGEQVLRSKLAQTPPHLRPE